jgi:fatty-acyl-CoA synthase
MDWESNWLEHRSRLTPDRIAAVESETGRRWTYGQLNERAGRLARYLREIGIGISDRVAHLAPNDLSCLDLFFACSKIGAIFVPLNWRLNAAELGYILQDCAPKLLVYDGAFGSVAEALPVPHKLKAGDDDYRRIVLDGPALREPGQARSGDDAMILYTSGTTGYPKGVVLLHRSIFWNAINTVISWNLTADDITPILMPMFHTGGLNALTFPVLLAGGTVVVVRAFDADRVFDILNRERCTIALMVPTMYQMMVRSPRFAEASFPTMRVFLSGGAPCPRSVYRAFGAKGFFFKEGYGLTEAGPNNFFLHPTMLR